ncbi:hypothetical protein ACFY7C_36745 [Streptomyces sp. NPDC012769]|uniref:hypothetical protein n=1 Tax=Streptomyces sp. NPDC012769 TaxID=3364848 RepID=UPI0036CFF77A
MSKSRRKRTNKWKSKERLWGIGNNQMATPIFSYNGSFRCDCGKVKHLSKDEAREILKKTGRIDKGHVYFCELSNTFHTSTLVRDSRGLEIIKRSSQKQIEAIMGINITLMREIEEYANQQAKQGVYKLSSKMVYEHFGSNNRVEIQSTLSRMRKDGKFTFIDEKVPDQKGAHYFVLTKFLTEKVVETVENKIPTQPKTTPVNPFDKVNKNLDEILKRLDNVPANTGLDEKRFLYLIHTALESSKHLANIGDAVFRSHEIIQTSSDHLTLTMREHLNEILVALSNKNGDYQRGIRDGIRMAVEMGIILPDGK